MKYKRIPFNYDWEELISQLIDDEEGDGVSLDLDNDILQLKSMKEIPWCEFPDDTPMKKTGMWVKDEGDGFVGYYIVYNGKEIYYTDYMENYNELINESNETYSLTLSTRNGRPLSQYGFYDISEEEVDIIKDMIKEEDVNGLWRYLFDVGYPDVVTIVLNLYDDDDDFLDYDLCDNKGNEVKSGQIRDLYKKVIGENYDKTIVNKEFHPEYLLISMDFLKKGQTVYYEVSKDIDVNKIKFYDSSFIGDNVLWWEWLGERTIEIDSFSYKGQGYGTQDYGDNGSLGESHFGLFKWNGTGYICISSL